MPNASAKESSFLSSILQWQQWIGCLIIHFWISTAKYSLKAQLLQWCLPGKVSLTTFHMMEHTPYRQSVLRFSCLEEHTLVRWGFLFKMEIDYIKIFNFPCKLLWTKQAHFSYRHHHCSSILATIILNFVLGVLSRHFQVGKIWQ